MCGIAGLFAHHVDRPVDPELLRRMADVIVHRGPDGSGVHVGAGYGLAHRRLSIVDLADGAQPMAADDVWVTFNGEIYNFPALRAELEGLGYRFRTRCDTEVLLHGWRAFGEDLPRRLRGMFAFALVDERTRTLFAARDRLGKKPFHYAELDGELVFGSELKSLLLHPGVSRTLDPEAVGHFLCLRYVPDPKTVFQGIRKLPPGCALVVRDGKVTERRYWQLSFAEPRVRSMAEWSEAVLAKFDEAVRIRLMGDVPLGAFLSGGVDSFAVVDSMARAHGGSVVACTMGFEDPEVDERAHARLAAQQCGAVLHEGVVTSADLLDQSWFDGIFDEPFADSSAIPTYHVSRLARQHVTVALSGDGGDEAFAGYRRYKYDLVENRVRGLLPRAVWGGLGLVYPKLDWLPRAVRFKRTFQNLALSPAEAYARSVSSVLPEEARAVLTPAWQARLGDPLGPVRAAYEASDGPDPLARAAAADYATWLPGDILVKVDRASMAVSLEVRAPLLDHELVELAASMPSAMKLADGETKGFLRRALGERLGREALARRKQGFHVPLRSWMAGPVGDALEASLADGACRADIIDPSAVRRLLAEHRSGARDHGELLWAVSVLQRFLARWT
ncbi:MAG: asparagine synthase (glutamine-hydrolyzing) [Planctomycetota bacterium]|jgi:asparagine synthase (glutamine-hydrolysing)